MADSTPNPNAITQGDTTPLVLTLSDSGGPVDIDTATLIAFRMKSQVPGAGHAPISGACSKLQTTDPVSGRITNKGMVEYAWQPGETDIIGNYGIQCQVTWADNTKRSFPNDRWTSFEIAPAAV